MKGQFKQVPISPTSVAVEHFIAWTRNRLLNALVISGVKRLKYVIAINRINVQGFPGG